MTELRWAGPIVLAVIVTIGSYQDIRFRRLPNWLCLFALVAGLGIGGLAFGLIWLKMAALHSLIALLTGMVLFALRVVGGGDAKFYAAIAAWLPVEYGLLLAFAVGLAGLAILIVWLPMRRRLAKAAGKERLPGVRWNVPYGVAISIGGVVVYGTAMRFW